MTEKSLTDKIKQVLNPTEEQIYLNKLETFRKHYIPERYNQVKMLDELINPEIDHFISISNRTDGKSFNYIHALLYIVIEYDLGITFLSRNMMLRLAYQELIEEIIEFSPIYNRKDFNFVRQQYYVTLNYKDRPVAIISDLNNATELKYFSNFLKNFPIIVYDEFIALPDDYLADEWKRLKTIYQSIDRLETYHLIGKPKIFYFGNAENFESPILHGLKIFNILEKHAKHFMNTAKIYQYDFNVMLEMHRNENANEQRNMRAFSSKDDPMTTARFDTNDYNIATENDKLLIKRNPRNIYVKLKNDYLRIWFNKDTLDIILSIESRIDDDYQYNMLLKDNKENSTYLKESYFSEKHIKKIDNGAYLFENNYSKNYITTDFHELNYLKIPKLIREVLKNDNQVIEIDEKEKQFQENYIEMTKQGLMRKFWG